MSLQTRLEALVAAIGADVKALRSVASENPTFTMSGPVTTLSGTQRYYAGASGTVTLSRASLGTVGTSTTTVVVKKNGTTVITLSLTSGTATITSSATVSLATGDYLTIDVTTAGTGAQNLTVQVRIT